MNEFESCPRQRWSSIWWCVPDCRAVEVAVACYAEGALLMGEAVGQDGRGKLIMMARDLSKPPVGSAIGSWPAGSGLRETAAELGLAIPGGRSSANPANLLPTANFTC